MNPYPASVPLHLLLLLLLLLLSFRPFIAADYGADISINCGSRGASSARSGHQWSGDVNPNIASLIHIGGASTTSTVLHDLMSGYDHDPVPYRTARLSRTRFSYSFQLTPGATIIRLHFNPATYKGFKRYKDVFTVEAGPFTLLSNFSASLATGILGMKSFTKEFCVSSSGNQQLSIAFIPASSTSFDTYAFINGIEIISLPSSVSYFNRGDVGVQLIGQSPVYVDNTSALEIVHRVNIKKGSASSGADDVGYMFGMLKKNTRIKPNMFNNFVWNISVDEGFKYLVRLHLSEDGFDMAESVGIGFKVSINEMSADTTANIARDRDDHSIPWYRDYMVMIEGGNRGGKCDLVVRLQPDSEVVEGHLPFKGFEIVKLSNPDGMLASPSSLPSLRNSLSGTIQNFAQVIFRKNAFATIVIALFAPLNIIFYILTQIFPDRSSNTEGNMPSTEADHPGRRFSFVEIQSATGNFSRGNLIGRGGFGHVYRGIIDNGEVVAIKRLKSNSNQGAKEFMTEIVMLSKVRHVNLVSLIGYCSEHGEMALVYEYIPSGTLADHLYRRSRQGDAITPLTWKQCLNVCIGAGRALEYLHTGQSIIHRDVKTSNILLDEDFRAKVSDFGLAKHSGSGLSQTHVSTNVKGTFGYLDPEYFVTGKLTRKSDTYSFGVVLLEVLCGRPAMDPWIESDEQNLSRWARGKILEGNAGQIVALSLRNQISEDSLRTFVGIAVRCLHVEPRNRPTMAQVVTELELALDQHEHPSNHSSATTNTDDIHHTNVETRQRAETSTDVPNLRTSNIYVLKLRSSPEILDLVIDFFLENLHRLQQRRPNLIKEVRLNVEKLGDDLLFFQTFLRNFTDNWRKPAVLKELICQVGDLIYDVEYTIDTLVSVAAESRPKINFPLRPIPTSSMLLNNTLGKVDSARQKAQTVHGIDFTDYLRDTDETEIDEEEKERESSLDRERRIHDEYRAHKEKYAGRYLICETERAFLDSFIEGPCQWTELWSNGTEVVTGSCLLALLFDKPIPGDIINVWNFIISSDPYRLQHNLSGKVAYLSTYTTEMSSKSMLHAPLRRPETLVGFEDEVQEIVGYLNEDVQQLDIISIIGMPGIGKTTLAGRIFHDYKIRAMFPTRIWVYVSRDFTKREVYVAILSEFTRITEDMLHKTDDWELARTVCEYLEKEKFLIVIDNVWTIEDWDSIQFAFPKSNNASKVLITTCDIEVARHASRQRAPLNLRFMTQEESWSLLQYEVFGKFNCPFELEVLGKSIAEQCVGLPLLIVVIGGILVTKLFTSHDMGLKKAAWEKVLDSMNACLKEDMVKVTEKIVALSYETLPNHLKVCFLYLGLFPEDFEIPMWKLIQMWIAEGFIQQKGDMSLEEIAQRYLYELINRNLVKVDKRRSDGSIKTCRIHGMLRDFCKNEAGSEKENFLLEMKKTPDGYGNTVSALEKCCHICIHSDVLNFISSKPLGSHVRSFVCIANEDLILPAENTSVIPDGFKLLRVLDVKPIKFTKIPSGMYQLVHLRYITLSLTLPVLPAAFEKLWNLETLIVETSSRTLDIKADILKMSQLRHVKTKASATLSKAGKSGKEGEKLQTLCIISPQSCTEDLFFRVGNLKKLGIRGRLALLLDGNKRLFVLRGLEKLKLINDVFLSTASQGQLRGLPPLDQFSPKLKSLTLSNTFLDWSHMSMLGSLKNLEVLKLKDNAFWGIVWEARDGAFRRLEVLHIGHTNLTFWVASHHHYPKLRRLQLHNCEELKDLPIGLADIQNFQMLDLYKSNNAATSAINILKAKKQNITDGEFKLSIFPPPPFQA